VYRVGLCCFLVLCGGVSARLALAANRAAATAPSILVFGDSLSAGYGIRVEHGWVSLLATNLAREGYGFRLVNASVSGETTAGGLARLPRALALHRPQIVILELGGNDGLRALPVKSMQANLSRMALLAEQAGARVVILGMRMPPNYGLTYTTQFAAVFDQLARAGKRPQLPFFLQHVADRPDWLQSDGIHPNEAGQPQLVLNVWPVLKPLLKEKAAASTRSRPTPAQGQRSGLPRPQCPPRCESNRQ
jgi:acyl-CoA thioesterase I